MCFEHCENCQPGQRRSSIGGVGHASWIPPSRRGHNKTGRRYGVYGIPLNKTISMRKSDLRWFETILDQPGFGQNHIWIDVLFILKGRIIVAFDLILSEVISHLHFKQQLEGPPRRSWVEMVAAGPQKPQILMSHSWGGYFRDFMAVIDKARVKDEPVRIYDIRYLTAGHNSYHKFRECRWCRCLFEE